MMFMLEEAVILVKLGWSEHCRGQMFYGVHELMVLCLKCDVNKIGVVRPLLH